MRQDLRFAIRMLRKQPGFTAIAVLTLALGIGATAAVVGLVQETLLTPPPYRDPARLVLIEQARAGDRTSAHNQGWTPAQWLDWKSKARSFKSIAAYDWSFDFLVQSDGSASLEGMWVTPEYFRVTGLHPLMGRIFGSYDTRPGATPVVILGYDVWQRRFGGDPAVIGRKIHISRRDTPPVVVG